VYVSRADSLEGIFADIMGIGRALDRPREADALVAAMRARLTALGARWRGSPRTSCAVVVWPSPLVVAARGSHVGDLIEAAGGLDVVGDAAQPFPSYSTERLVALAPAVLIVGTHSTGAPTLDALMRLESIPAVQDRRVHLIDGDLLFRPGPRVVDGVAAILEVLHPPMLGARP
jgi:ABC-type Fe3+-hydroxamate transport system substrate-binding protein